MGIYKIIFFNLYFYIMSSEINKYNYTQVKTDTNLTWSWDDIIALLTSHKFTSHVSDNERSPEEDKKAILTASNFSDLYKTNKFGYVQDGVLLNKLKSVVTHNKDFDIRLVKNTFYMFGILNHIHPNYIHKLYDWDSISYNDFEGNNINWYLRSLSIEQQQELPLHVKDILHYTFQYLFNRWYCPETALKTFTESLENQIWTFVLSWDNVYYIKTDARNKTAININTGDFGCFNDYTHSLLLKIVKLISNNRDISLYNDIKSISTINGFKIITLSSDELFWSSSIDPYRENTENVLLTSPDELKVIAKKAKKIFEWIS